MTSISDIVGLDPFEFEELVSDIWESKGYVTTVRKKSGDRGVDVEAEKGGYKEIIQAKCYSENNKIGSQLVREYATLYQQIPTANEVIIVTSSSFTKEAKRLADDLNVKIIDGNQLIKQIQEYSVEIEPSKSNNSTQSSGATGGMSYSERKEKAKELSRNSMGDISARRMTLSGSGNSDFSGGDNGSSPVETFVNGRGELDLKRINHQPHYVLTNRSKGLSDIYCQGECAMWITDQGIHWFLSKVKSSDKVTEYWKFLPSNIVKEVEYREGIFKNRVIINSRDEEFDFFVNTSDPAEEAVDYMVSEYLNATLIE